MARRGSISIGALVVIWLSLASPLSAQPAVPTFSRDVAPIVFAHCANCHFPEGPGPFSLTSYPSARQHAQQMAAATARRYMPPWKPAPGSGDFVGAHRLTTEQIATIRRWAEGGAPEGDPASLPPAPKTNSGWQNGTPDLVVDLPAYDLPASGQDVFRIFVVPVPVTTARFVRGFEFQPHGSNIVHHANIRVDRTDTSRTLDAEDPQPGYEGLLARSAIYPDGHFLAWTPGQAAPLLPKGLAWRLEPTTDLVVELHLQPTGKAERIQPSIGLFFGNDPPERVPGMIRLGRQNIDIAAGDAAYRVTDSFTLPVDVQVLAVQPHAHYLARDVSGSAVLPDGTTRPLIAIPDWDFRWQQVYRYVTPLALPAGTTLRMTYRYDNSAANVRNPQQPPGRVIWGQRSADEMGDLWIQVLTRTDADLDRLMTALRPKVIAEDIVGYQARLRVEPDSVALHDDLALLFLDQQAPERAVEEFRRSAALRPDSARAQFNLGVALTFAGRDADAVAAYERALQLRPDYGRALNNLGGLLLRRGDVAGAAPYLERAVRNEPSNGDAQQNLGVLYRARGERVAARDRFQRAGSAYAGAEDWARATAALEQALALADEPLASELRERLARFRARLGGLSEAR